ncbi:MAG: hypothetical protein P8099_03190 [Gemmatimonadota bacterium]|jgi:hypothetical protein
MLRTACSLAATVLSLASLAPATQKGERTFSDPSCHVTFRYPADWVVRPASMDSGSVCGFRIRPLAWDSLIVEADSVEGAWTILLKVRSKGFDEAIGSSPFERRDSGWVVLGRLGLENVAVPVARNGWRGLRGDAPFGCYRMGGGYMGACEFPVALVGTDDYSATLESGGGGAPEVFERILETLRFLPMHESHPPRPPSLSGVARVAGRRRRTTPRTRYRAQDSCA